MKIVKYIVLIFLLFSLGVFVYIATASPRYSVSKSIFINSKKTTVFNYLIDYKNWEAFDSKILESNKNLKYSNITYSKGSWISWEGEEDGRIETKSFIPNENIEQEIVLNSKKSKVSWFLKDSIGGTKVIWKSIGEVDFETKLKSFFNGGIENKLASEFEQNITNLNKNIQTRLQTYSIKNIGLVNRVGTYYIHQTINCTDAKASENIKILITSLRNYSEKNGIPKYGFPFVMFKKDEKTPKIVQLSVCLPTKDSLILKGQENIKSNKLNSFTAIKTRLIGDKIHIKKAWNSAFNYILKNKLLINNELQISEVYVKTLENTNNTSDWITDLYTPVTRKKLPVKKYYRPRRDTTKVAPVAAPAPLPVVEQIQN